MRLHSVWSNADTSMHLQHSVHDSYYVLWDDVPWEYSTWLGFVLARTTRVDIRSARERP